MSKAASALPGVSCLRHYASAAQLAVVMLTGVVALWILCVVVPAHADECVRHHPPEIIVVTCAGFEAPANDLEDAAPMIQSAINAASVGGEVFLPTGIFLLGRSLTVVRPVTFTGTGTLYHTANITSMLVIGPTVANVKVVGLTFEAPAQSTLRSSAIRVLGGSTGVTLERNVFRNISSTCILLIGNGIANVMVRSNIAKEFYEQFFEIATGGVKSVSVLGNTILSSRGHPNLGSTEPFGIMIEAKQPGTIRNIIIENNYISFAGMANLEQINTGGISVRSGRGGASPYSIGEVTIANNVVEQVGHCVGVQELHLGANPVAARLVVRRNKCTAMKNNGMKIAPTGDGVRGAVLIEENSIRGYSLQAFNIYDGIALGGALTAPMILNNDVLPAVPLGPRTGRYALSLSSSVLNPVVDGNVLEGWRTGDILGGIF